MQLSPDFRFIHTFMTLYLSGVINDQGIPKFRNSAAAMWRKVKGLVKSSLKCKSSGLQMRMRWFTF